MFEWFRIVKVIFGSCVSHNRGEYMTALCSALANARAVQKAAPIPWVEITEPNELPDRTWCSCKPEQEDDPYYWVVATEKGWLPFPWFEGRRPTYAPSHWVASSAHAITLLESEYGL